MSINASGLHNHRITRIFLNRYSKLINSCPHSLNFSANLPLLKKTTTCVDYVPTTEATYAALCAPSLQVNAPAPNSEPGYRVVQSFQVASKMDCCAACTSVFNCAWWKFDFGTSGDGWAPGTCHYAYYIGTEGNLGGEAPAICPNGVTLGITNYNPDFGNEANNNEPGYNFGPCGGAYGEFESNEDFGLPNDYLEYICGQPADDPTSSPPGCA
jgi:hypothetical protein